MTNTFQQLNHKTGRMYTVVTHDDGHWHSFMPSTRGVQFYNSLTEFQECFNCPNDELAMIKLKHGEPRPRLYRKIRVT